MAVPAALCLAAAIAVAAMAMSPAVEAGFLYVPQDGPAANAIEAAAGAVPEGATRDAHGRAAVEENAPRPGSGLWQVHAGETLREVLARWGGHAGIEVLFLTDRRYRLHEGRGFSGSFEEATQALFAALSHLPHPPAGEARADGRTVAVLHRASPHRAHPAGDRQ